jgi:Fe-S oxidoreductase/nitrate reductase gamma subunit
MAMADAGIAGRQIFESMSPAMVVAFYGIAWGAMAIFAWGLWRRFTKYRSGQAVNIFDRLWTRVFSITQAMATHSTLRKRNGLIGCAHWLIFWGFIALFVGSLIIMVDEDILGTLSPTSQFWRGNFYKWYSLILDLFGLGFMLGLGIMAARRWIGRPFQLDYSRPDRKIEEYDRRPYAWDDQIFLWGLFFIGATGFVNEALRIAVNWPAFEIWSTVGWHLAKGFSALGLSSSGANELRPYVWWLHAVLALALIAYIPYSKGVHVVTGLVNLLLRNPLAGKRLPAISDDAAGAGYASLSDFSWKELLDLDACTKCGRCHAACPARAGGWPLSPRDVILELRENAERNLRPVTLLRERKSKAPDHQSGALGITAETLWSCTTCLACVETCPVGVEHVPLIVQMRRNLVEKGNMDRNLQGTLENFARCGNSFGAPESDRGKWAEDLDFKIDDARIRDVDFLWFVGDFASYDPNLRKVTQSVARVFRAAGLNFGILFDDEKNAGNDIRRVGEEGLFAYLSDHNSAVLAQAKFKRIVTTDPHSYNTLKHEYPNTWPILHYTELINDLIEDGRLTIRRRLEGRVTYHDPCHLSRYNDVTDAPRKILTALGLELVEMRRNRANSFCCGAGGGRIWMTDRGAAERPSEQRIKEALEIDGIKQFIVACPKDFTMYREAVKATRNEERLRVSDIIELVEEATLCTERIMV